MEIYDDEYLDQFISAKFIGIGAAGASASDYFSEVGNDLFPERLIVSNEDDIAGLQAKIARVDWLFVITDIEDLKIAETGLTSNELINRIINVTASPFLKCRIKSLNPRELNYIFSGDMTDVRDTIENFGKAYIGFGKSLDAENSELDAVRKALKSPLFIEDIGKAKKIFLVFVVRRESYERKSIGMMAIDEAVTFLDELINPDPEDSFPILFQVLIDETFGDGVTAFVLATNFDFGNGGRKLWKSMMNPTTNFFRL